MSAKYCVIITTTDDENVAKTIAKSLIEKRLAACVQLVAINSFYRWNKTIVDAQEFKLEIKTCSALIESVSKEIKALHNYDLPEIITLDITHTSYEYGEWIEKETTQP